MKKNYNIGAVQNIAVWTSIAEVIEIKWLQPYRLCVNTRGARFCQDVQ